MLRNKAMKRLIPMLLALVLISGIIQAGTLGPAAQWSFDEGSGSVALDSVGYSNGILVGAPVWDSANKPPLSGNAYSLRFDGIDDYVNVTENDTLDVDYVTLSAWVYIDAANAAEQANIIRKGATGTGTDRVFGLTVRKSGVVRGFVIPEANVSSVIDADGGAALSKSTWHHIAMTYDGQKVNVYLDGIWDHASGTVPGVIAENDRNVLIGGGIAGWCFKGNIDEVRLYSRALSAAEIASLADTTLPILTLPADITVEATKPSGAVVVFAPTANDSVDGALTVTCIPTSGFTFPLGSTTVQCSATDANGNTATGEFIVKVVDTTPPVLYLPENMVIESMGPYGVAVVFNATAADIADELVTVVCNPESGSIFPVGTTSVACTAVDDSGNFVSGSFTVTVSNAFTGFFHPIDLGGIVNVAKAGSAIPIKFSLGGDRGLDIFKAGYPVSIRVEDFETGAVTDVIDQTVSAGSSGLTYDPLSDQYTYVWKTPKLWAGTCRQLIVVFADGSQAPLVNFRFIK